MIKIYADKRERDETIFKILNKKCKIIEKQLDIADFVVGKETGLERKTTADFLQSIIDSRLFEQTERLKKTYKNPVIIIEGNMENFYHLRNIHPNAVRGALSKITIDYGVPIFWTNDKNQTAEMVFFLAKKEQETNKENFSIRAALKFKSANQMQEFIVSGLPHVNHKLSQRLLKRFKNPEKVFRASEKELADVKGIGKKKAKAIRNILLKNYQPSILDEE